MLDITEIHLSDGTHKIGWIELANPKRLNVLTLEMVTTLNQRLTAWLHDDSIAAVLLTGAGNKGFCAGGDVVEISSLARHSDQLLATAPYFIQEYQVDHLIHRYPKPVIVLGDGIVMGGGLGLFAGASHRIVTRLSLLSMPEITIGLFPDVGATWFLNRMPGRCGLFAAMTAARMNAADALYLGLADYYLPEMNRDTLVSWLATLPLSGNHEQNHTQLDEALTASATPLPEMDMPSHFHQHMGLISHVCDSQDPLIINRMIEALDPPDEWMNQCRSHHLDGSPLSVCVMASQLREGRFLDLEAVFRKELDMAVNMSRHQEFAIGVKALLIDKNRSPQWTWKQVDEVPESSVADLLSSPWTEEQHPFYQLNPNPGRGLEIK